MKNFRDSYRHFWADSTHCSRCGLKRSPRYPNGNSYIETIYGPFGKDCTCIRGDWR